MSDTHLALPSDGGPDDLPRTLRRAREAKEREAQARESALREGGGREPADASGGQTSSGFGSLEPDMRNVYAEELTPASVRSIDVSFVRLMLFFLKAVIAAIPAIILLTAILWVGGQMLKMLVPQLIHAEILIRFPN